MSVKRPRAERVPNANNPRLLMRLVGVVASGIRRPKALAEVLDVELRTIHYYTQAGEWLGLLATDGDVYLTDRGLELAMAKPRKRRQLYVDAVWRNAFAKDLMSHGRLPDVEIIASFIEKRDPTMAASTARRRASAVRGLLLPADGRSPSPDPTAQLQLSFPPAKKRSTTAPDLRAGRTESPDVYALILQSLLDHGELSTGNVRAILDNAAKGELPLAGYLDLALRRGDAERMGDRLVVTAAACTHLDLAQDPVMIALTDPPYRDYLAQVSTKKRVPAATRRRFEAWDRRVFGDRCTPTLLSRQVPRILLGRKIEGLPIRTPEGASSPIREVPFCEALGTSGFIATFSGVLRDLPTGVGVLNDQLRAIRRAPASVRLPRVVDPRRVTHGTLFYPGEALPSSVPDNFSLRLRAMSNVPLVSLSAALLLLDRRPDLPLIIRRSGDTIKVLWDQQDLGDLVAVHSQFLEDQGGLISRSPTGTLDPGEVGRIIEGMGIGAFVGDRLVLDEDLFLRLQQDPEVGLVYDQLAPVADRYHAWLDDR